WTLVSGPLPSIGSPRVLTTRPSTPSPTGTERMLPVALTVWPSSIESTSPSTTAPIESSSRLSARPNRPDSNSSSSLTAASGSPATRAMPSPTSMTRPTWVSSTSGAKPSRFFLIAAVMSAVLIVSSAISEGLSELVQAGTDGAVEDGVADLGDDATHHGRVDDVADGDVDVRAGLGGPGEIGELGVGERHRGA